MNKFIKSTKFIFISLLFISLIAYGQILFMYFWIDDSALIYKLQHLDQSLGFWGKGAIGQGPYRHIVNQFVPFYPIFKINPVPYFAVGLLLYFLTSLAVYFFSISLTRNKSIALIAAAIFASGYVGSESIFGITNSWQTSRGIIMAFGTFWLYYKYLKSKKLIFYILSVILFFFSLDTIYIRAHGLIIALFLFDIIFSPVLINFKSLLGLFTRQIAFIVIHYNIYLTGGGYASSFGIWTLLKDIFDDGKYYLLFIPFEDLGNLFFPSIISEKINLIISQYINLPKKISTFSVLFSLVIIFFTTYLVAKFRKSQKLLTKVLLFSFIWAVANFIIFYLRETNHSLWTTHRYFSYSFAMVSLFYASAIYLTSQLISVFNKDDIRIMLSSIIVITYLALGVTHQHQFNKERSSPAKKFFYTFEQSLPQIPKGAYLYFDIKNDNKVKKEFGSFFGGMFSEAANLAIYSEGIDYTNDFIFTYKFEDVLKALAEGRVSLNNVFTFYYDDKGLIDTTADVRKLLQSNLSVNLSTSHLKSTTPYQIVGREFVTSPQFAQAGTTIVTYPKIYFEPDQHIPSLIPSNLTFSMKIAPLLPPLPFQSPKQTYQVSNSQKSMIFDYLISQDQYFKTASASAASYWKEQESRLAIDNRLETAWRGHRGFWDEIFRKHISDKEFFSVDLKTVKRISQIRWVTAQTPLIPTEYSILVSPDAVDWQLVKNVSQIRNLPHSSEVVDSFNPIDARFVKMEIYKTLGNDGPEIKEFEVVEEKFAYLDRNLTAKVKEDPFSKIESSQDYSDALTFVLATAKIRIYFKSDADVDQDPTKYQELSALIDGQFHEYSLDLPASGANWIRFSLEGINFPAKIEIVDPVIKF